MAIRDDEDCSSGANTGSIRLATTIARCGIDDLIEFVLSL